MADGRTPRAPVWKMEFPTRGDEKGKTQLKKKWLDVKTLQRSANNTDVLDVLLESWLRAEGLA